MFVATDLQLEDYDFTEASFLSNHLQACVEIVSSSDDRSDLWLSERHSIFIRTRTNSLLNRLSKSREEIDAFEYSRFDGRNFKDVINNGEKTFADLVALLEDRKTQKFKRWLAEGTDTASLIEEYDRAVFGEGWTRTVPQKSWKIAIFGGVGFSIDLLLGTSRLSAIAAAGIAAVADVGIDASDQFILSRLAGGWKPNQFIEGPAAKFLARPDLRDDR